MDLRLPQSGIAQKILMIFTADEIGMDRLTAFLELMPLKMGYRMSVLGKFLKTVLVLMIVCRIRATLEKCTFESSWF